MGIDRIGKGSAPPPPKPATETEKTRGPEGAKAFELRPEARPEAHPAGRVGTEGVAPAAPSAGGALERLRRGEVDLDGYLDLKVDEATKHLKGMPAADLERIRAVLRDEIASNPALARLVQQATGEVPRTKE